MPGASVGSCGLQDQMAHFAIPGLEMRVQWILIPCGGMRRMWEVGSVEVVPERFRNPLEILGGRWVPRVGA